MSDSHSSKPKPHRRKTHLKKALAVTTTKLPHSALKSKRTKRLTGKLKDKRDFKPNVSPEVAGRSKMKRRKSRKCRKSRKRRKSIKRRKSRRRRR